MHTDCRRQSSIGTDEKKACCMSSGSSSVDILKALDCELVNVGQF